MRECRQVMGQGAVELHTILMLCYSWHGAVQCANADERIHCAEYSTAATDVHGLSATAATANVCTSTATTAAACVSGTTTSAISACDSATTGSADFLIKPQQQF